MGSPLANQQPTTFERKEQDAREATPVLVSCNYTTSVIH